MFDDVEEPQIFFTGKNNFREAIAKKKQYKGNRDRNTRPFHYSNLKAYMLTMYNCEIVNGMEADDMLAIVQTSDWLTTKAVVSGGEWGGANPQLKDECNTIICTRDKDLRQVPGWHFGWELGKQPQYGPKFVEEPGEIELINRKEIKGCGSKFFYAQLIVGDKTDNIPGLDGFGPVRAFEILHPCTTIPEMEKAVVEAYRQVYGDVWREELMEQAALVWMVREFDEEGNPIMWRLNE